MNKFIFTLTILLSLQSYAASPSGIKYDCETIVDECTKSNEFACQIGEFNTTYLNEIIQECKNLGTGELTLDNLFEARFIAWLLAIKLNEAAEIEPPSFEQEEEIRTLMTITAHAIAPIPNTIAVKKRFNTFVRNREVVLRGFSRVMAAHPQIGVDYISYLYDIAMFDYNASIRANAVSNIQFLDANKKNVNKVTSHYMTDTTAYVFNGSNDGNFEYERIPKPSYYRRIGCLLPMCSNSLKQEFKNGDLLNSPDGLL